MQCTENSLIEHRSDIDGAVSSLGQAKGLGGSARTDGSIGGLLRTLALSGQLDGPTRPRASWLRSGERPGDRLVLGIVLATSHAAPRRRAKRSWLM